MTLANNMIVPDSRAVIYGTEEPTVGLRPSVRFRERQSRGNIMTTSTIDRSKRKATEITYLLGNAAAFLNDLRVALRSLGRTRALWATVTLTLALGIGVNAAIFSVVRGVLLRPLVNRDEDRLIYLQQSAPGSSVSPVSTRFQTARFRYSPKTSGESGVALLPEGR